MKKMLILFVCISLLSGCLGHGTSYMVESDRKPAFGPQAEMATLVIIRDQRLGFPFVFLNYLDGKFIGDTKGLTYFTTSVKAGPHYVVAQRSSDTNSWGAKNAVTYLNFEPGKIYYLYEVIGGWGGPAGFFPMDIEWASKSMNACTYIEYDPTKGVPDMDPKLYQQAITNYHVEVKQNPSEFKEMLEYKGYHWGMGSSQAN